MLHTDAQQLSHTNTLASVVNIKTMLSLRFALFRLVLTYDRTPSGIRSF